MPRISSPGASSAHRYHGLTDISLNFESTPSTRCTMQWSNFDYLGCTYLPFYLAFKTGSFDLKVWVQRSSSRIAAMWSQPRESNNEIKTSPNIEKTMTLEGQNELSSIYPRSRRKKSPRSGSYFNTTKTHPPIPPSWAFYSRNPAFGNQMTSSKQSILAESRRTNGRNYKEDVDDNSMVSSKKHVPGCMPY